MRAITLEDPYAQLKNVIHPPKQITELTAYVKSTAPQIARQLGRIVNACYHVGHALFSDMHPSTVYDNFGPYDVSTIFGEGHVAVIKDFRNLRQTDIWQEAGVSTCDHIQIVAVYKDVSIRIDGVSHIIYEGDTIGGLTHYAVFMDGVPIDVNFLDMIAEKLERLASNVFTKFKSFDLEKRKELYYTMRAYAYKKIYDRLEQDWRPSVEILAEAQGKPLHPITWSEEKAQLREKVRQILDPRIDLGDSNQTKAP